MFIGFMPQNHPRQHYRLELPSRRKLLAQLGALRHKRMLAPERVCEERIYIDKPTTIATCFEGVLISMKIKLPSLISIGV